MPSVRRRRYWNTQKHLHKFTSLADYHTLSDADCVAALEQALIENAPCYRFLDKSDILPMIHNMVSTVHLSTDLSRIDLTQVFIVAHVCTDAPLS